MKIDRLIRTADGIRLGAGARAFNHYDRKAGVIVAIDTHPQPDPSKGQSSGTPMAEWSNYWFDFRHDDGTVTMLDGSRICSVAHARARGWLK